jgi:hypothetical protein
MKWPHFRAMQRKAQEPAMTHRFDFRDSTVGMEFGQIENLFFPNAGMEIANGLWRGDRVVQGTLRYVDPGTGEWVTEATWMNAMGDIGTGTPVVPAPLPPGVPRTDAFVALLGGGANGYVRLFGTQAPELAWDSTAENADRDLALAEFAANAAAAQADYLAQIDAVLGQRVSRMDYEFGGTVLDYRPDPGAILTWGDLLGRFFEDGFFILGGPFGTDGQDGYGDVFAPDASVTVLLGDGADSLTGQDFSGSDLTIRAGGGDDFLDLFTFDVMDAPQRLAVHGGTGDDDIRIGAFAASTVEGGAGNDVISAETVQGPAPTTQWLYGGADDDGITGALREANHIDGGSGDDGMLGGLRDDTIIGGNGDDVMLGIDGDDLMSGGKGRDLLEGYDGQDTLDGGTGNDTLDGGSEIDTFVFGARCGHDDLVTYEEGELILIDAGFWSGSVADFVAAQVTISASEVVTIRLDSNNSITLPGTKVPEVAALAEVISFV